jgi:hypothetical protein
MQYKPLNHPEYGDTMFFRNVGTSTGLDGVTFQKTAFLSHRCENPKSKKVEILIKFPSTDVWSLNWNRVEEIPQ